MKCSVLNVKMPSDNEEEQLTQFGMHKDRSIVILTMKTRILDQIAKHIIMTISHVNNSEKNI